MTQAPRSARLPAMMDVDSHMSGLLRNCLALLVVALVAGTVVPYARAEDEGQSGSSYVALYPPGDVYQIEVVGDDIAEGLLEGLSDAVRGDPKLQVKPKPLVIDQLMRQGFTDQLKALDDGLVRDQPTITVVMFGPQDRISFKGPNGKKYWIDSDEWRAEFGRQIDLVMKTLKHAKQAVYWVSLPNVRRSEPNEDVQVLNDIIREKVLLNGLKYIDAYAGFVDEGGGYSAMGPDINGKIRLLREQNGVGFTDAGNRKLAHFVERELRRDVAQALSDRTIPLAGSVAEQQAISASRSAADTGAKTAAAGPQGSAAGAAPSAQAPGPQSPPPSGSAEQRADTGRINLAISGPGGKEEIVPVDLLRPAIPASIIALVNRKENADKPAGLGDLLIDQIPGGLLVMSSITPANDTTQGENRRRLAPTQTPYFRVMVKGERIAPREGRADDVSWPRPEPPPVVEPVSLKEPVDAAPAASTPATPPKPAKKGSANVKAKRPNQDNAPPADPQ